MFEASHAIDFVSRQPTRGAGRPGIPFVDRWTMPARKSNNYEMTPFLPSAESNRQHLNRNHRRNRACRTQAAETIGESAEAAAQIPGVSLQGPVGPSANGAEFVGEAGTIALEYINQWIMMNRATRMMVAWKICLLLSVSILLIANVPTVMGAHYLALVQRTDWPNGSTEELARLYRQESSDEALRLLIKSARIQQHALHEIFAAARTVGLAHLLLLCIAGISIYKLREAQRSQCGGHEIDQS